MKNTFFKEHGFAIIFVVVFLLAFVWMGTKRTILSNQNDVTDWLPKTFAETKDYNWFLRHFPFEKFLLISWEGCTIDDERLEMLAQKLVPGQTIDNMDLWTESLPIVAEIEGAEIAPVFVSPPTVEQQQAAGQPRQYFKTVLTGQRLLHFMQERFPDLPKETIVKRLDGLLIGPGKTAEGNIVPLEERHSAMLVTLIPDVRGKELRKVLSRVHELAQECNIELPPPPDVRSMPEKIKDVSYEFVRELFYGRNPTTEGAIIGGPPVDNVNLDYEGERTLYRLAGLCALFGACLSMLCFQDLRLTMIVFWIAVLSAGVAMALVWATGGRCDSILLSMPALIYVLTMSGAIHIINYYHDAIREHGLFGAAETAISNGWFPCFMSAFTTAIGLGSLYLSHLVPIMKFGFYSALGVMTALLLLFFYLPSLLHFYPSRKFAEKHGGKGMGEDKQLITLFWKYFGGLVIKYNKTVAVLCLMLMCFMAFGIFKINVSIRMMRFFSQDAEIIKHYGWLEDKLGPLVPMEIVLVFDNAQLQKDKDGNAFRLSSFKRMKLIDEIGNALRTDLSEEVGGVMSASTMAPKLDYSPAGFGAKRRLQATDAALSGGLDRNRAALHDYIDYDGNPMFSVSAERLDDVLFELSADEETVDPVMLRLMGVHRTPEDLQTFLAEIGISESDAQRLNNAGVKDVLALLQTQPGKAYGNVTADELTDFREKAAKWQKEFSHDIWRISLRVWALKKEINYADFVSSVKGVVDPMIASFLEENNLKTAALEENNLKTAALTAKYTGMVPVVYKTQNVLIDGLVQSLVMSFVLIMIVMACILRSPVAGFLAMMPNLFPVVIVFGFMGWRGVLVDVGTMMTASVALGIAVDNTIHFLTWFRFAVDQGQDAKAAAAFAYKRCATAMTQTTLIGGLGLSAFVFSTFVPTQMFGIMMLSILSVALVGDLIFLPSILTGPAGKYFMPKKKK